MSLNQVILVGNVGHDPEMKYTANGTGALSLNVATNKSILNKAGVREKVTQWHRVVVFGKQAEACQENLKKGHTIYVLGELQHREYQDKTGTTRKITEVYALSIKFLTQVRREEHAQAPKPLSSSEQTLEEVKAQYKVQPVKIEEPSIFDEDVPF